MEDTYFENYKDLLLRLSEVFDYLQPEELRDMLFFLENFNKDQIVPKDAEIFVGEVPFDGLEISSEDKVPDVLIGGTSKFQQLEKKKEYIAPVVIAKGEVRLLIVYGEMNAIEAYIRKMPLTAIFIDFGKKDIFKTLKLNPDNARLLTPIIEEQLNPEQSQEA